MKVARTVRAISCRSGITNKRLYFSDEIEKTSWKLSHGATLCSQGFARMQQRAFAEKAVAAEVDWDSISNLIHSDEGKRELASLRSTFLDIQTRLTGMTKDTPAPSWAEWKKDLDPKIVDGFKQAFESKS